MDSHTLSKGNALEQEIARLRTKLRRLNSMSDDKKPVPVFNRESTKVVTGQHEVYYEGFVGVVFTPFEFLSDREWEAIVSITTASVERQLAAKEAELRAL